MINTNTTFVNKTQYEDAALKQLNTKNMQDENLKKYVMTLNLFLHNNFWMSL